MDYNFSSMTTVVSNVVNSEVTEWRIRSSNDIFDLLQNAVEGSEGFSCEVLVAFHSFGQRSKCVLESIFGVRCSSEFTIIWTGGNIFGQMQVCICWCAVIGFGYPLLSLRVQDEGVGNLFCKFICGLGN